MITYSCSAGTKAVTVVQSRVMIVTLNGGARGSGAIGVRVNVTPTNVMAQNQDTLVGKAQMLLHVCKRANLLRKYRYAIKLLRTVAQRNCHWEYDTLNI